MSGKIVKKINLENKQTLTISDCSRKIGADAYVVIMKANIEIEINPELFADVDISDFRYEDIRATLGDKVIYEYRLERNFIMDHEKEDVFESLFQTYLDTMGKYVAKKIFPAKLVLKEYKDRL